MNYTAEQIMELVDLHAIAVVEAIERNPNADWDKIRNDHYAELQSIANNYESMSKKLKEYEGMEVHFPYCDPGKASL